MQDREVTRRTGKEVLSPWLKDAPEYAALIASLNSHLVAIKKIVHSLENLRADFDIHAEWRES